MAINWAVREGRFRQTADRSKEVRISIHKEKTKTNQFCIRFYDDAIDLFKGKSIVFGFDRYVQDRLYFKPVDIYQGYTIHAEASGNVYAKMPLPVIQDLLENYIRPATLEGCYKLHKFEDGMCYINIGGENFGK